MLIDPNCTTAGEATPTVPLPLLVPSDRAISGLTAEKISGSEAALATVFSFSIKSLAAWFLKLRGFRSTDNLMVSLAHEKRPEMGPAVELSTLDLIAISQGQWDTSTTSATDT
jgi:hypothetical protein